MLNVVCLVYFSSNILGKLISDVEALTLQFLACIKTMRLCNSLAHVKSKKNLIYKMLYIIAVMHSNTGHNNISLIAIAKTGCRVYVAFNGKNHRFPYRKQNLSVHCLCLKHPSVGETS